MQHSATYAVRAALLRQGLEALVQLRRPFIRDVPRGNDLQCQISKVQQRP